MQVVVDYEQCESNALCVGAAPEVFVLDADDRLQLLIERPPPELRAKVEQAVRRCPKQALSIVED